ncbi:hypothetical protein [Tateyamaria omphalii]|uniref:Uncharacterized protein n=1 Tax=Tateyamaria omphalii TaxID=299262 RepID=A0A1P8N1Z4_9RHOB|nr:hypothetical protein [Tateyamaria omphalii]APX14312.1 hypothetical protein BWR18_20945 [Tateyamaria omphalii]
MRHFLTLFLVFIGLSVIHARLAHAELKLFEVGEFKVADRVNSGELTMSGSHQHRIRTDKLFAAFHLLNSETEDRAVDLGGQFQHAPIWLPAEVEPEKLRLCADIRSINGYYLADGRASLLDAAVSENLGMRPIPYTAEHTDEVRNQFREKYLLPRVVVATDCDERRSKYYVPVSWDPEPDKLLAVVEIGASTVKATMQPVGLDNNLIASFTPVSMTCEPTERVQAGYDCTVSLNDLKDSKSDAYELRLEIDRPGMEPAVRTARISLPRQ